MENSHNKKADRLEIQDEKSLELSNSPSNTVNDKEQNELSECARSLNSKKSDISEDDVMFGFGKSVQGSNCFKGNDYENKKLNEEQKSNLKKFEYELAEPFTANKISRGEVRTLPIPKPKPKITPIGYEAQTNQNTQNHLQ